MKVFFGLLEFRNRGHPDQTRDWGVEFFQSHEHGKNPFVSRSTMRETLDDLRSSSVSPASYYVGCGEQMIMNVVDNIITGASTNITLF